jgi:hypothetical protein
MPFHRRTLRRWCAAPLVLVAAACTDDPVAPRTPDAAAGQTAFAECQVDVHARTLICSQPRVAPATPNGVRADVTLGGQDVYVKMASSGTSYDSGTEILSSSVTVQNLLQKMLGTPDGSTVSGVKVFFTSGPTVTSGTGTVTVANATGTGLFTSNDQPYFLYNEILTPYQISSALQWQFNVPSTVSTFKFQVAISAQAYGSGGYLDRVWTGAADSVWESSANWQGGLVPDSTSTVSIPSDSLLASHRMPYLGGSADITNLRVGYGSTVHLAGFTLRARGNVDATGSVSGGTVWMSGSGALLGGSVNALQVSGSTKLQATTKASAAVAVSGHMAVSDHVLTISVP